MSLLTESQLRFELKSTDLDAMKEFWVENGTVVTPAARDFLREHRIALRYGEVPAYKTEHSSISRQDFFCNVDHREEKDAGADLQMSVPAQREKAIAEINGEPEQENKTLSMLRLHSKLESLEARILEVQLIFQKRGMHQAVEQLGSTLEYTREIVRCLVQSKELEEPAILGMSSEEISQRSQNPQQYYGIPHFSVRLEHGEGVILLNTLRAQARETALDAYKIFQDDCGAAQQEDILRGLNRLASFFYVMMFQMLTRKDLE
ncbi:hypothetical protein [Clostridium minihomine]|uniref:hypothetical protein n=1 Tax=Clostridium minihomine TaxID=2045012 RepID=UPI000C79106E|nr:hypothetical protein [Clostridium minihomine]